MTEGFDLPAKWVIHTVGPIWQDGKHSESERLTACYRNSLELALKIGNVGSIAFPGISTGVYGYPKRDAATIALTEMRRYTDRFDRIIACCFGAEDENVYREMMKHR